MIEVWGDFKNRFGEDIERASKSEMRIELKNGGVLEMWTLEKPDPGRGRKYAAIVVDEAAMARNLIPAWYESIRPTLTDLKGTAWFLSTPKGRNGFWQLYQYGLDPKYKHWACWTMPTVRNPFIDPIEIEEARGMTPERVFQQEYEALFLDDGGGVFKKVMRATTAQEQEANVFGHRYIVGVDWGKVNDFSVFIVIDLDLRAVVCMERYNELSYVYILQQLKDLCDRFMPMTVIVERNTVGIPLIDFMMAQYDLPIVAFTTTNSSKAAVVDALILAFQNETIEIINDPILVGELLSYDLEKLPSGQIRYGAPEGMHDDCVTAICLAWSEVDTPAYGEGIMVLEDPVEISTY